MSTVWLSKGHDATMAEVALAWLHSKALITCPIVGASSVSQLENNVNALDLELTADEIETLDQLYKPRDVINDYVPEPMPRYLRKNT